MRAMKPKPSNLSNDQCRQCHRGALGASVLLDRRDRRASPSRNLLDGSYLAVASRSAPTPDAVKEGKGGPTIVVIRWLSHPRCHRRRELCDKYQETMASKRRRKVGRMPPTPVLRFVAVVASSLGVVHLFHTISTGHEVHEGMVDSMDPEKSSPYRPARKRALHEIGGRLERRRGNSLAGQMLEGKKRRSRRITRKMRKLSSKSEKYSGLKHVLQGDGWSKVEELLGHPIYHAPADDCH